MPVQTESSCSGEAASAIAGADSSDQRKIWAYFQNHDLQKFEGSTPRLDFMAREMAWRAQSPSPRVLNIGAGSGYLERKVQDRKWRPCSLDIDGGIIKKLGSEGIAGCVGSAADAPFRGESFDFVIASEVLEHLAPRACDDAIREIARMVRRGGWLLGSVPFEENLNDVSTVCPRCGCVFHRWGHQASFSAEKLHAMLSAAGFGSITVKCTTFPSFNGPLKRKLKSLIKLALARIGEPVANPTLFFVARR
jgi:SAM-dependent methyltransferase